jgi:hypothetical protein
VCGTGSRARISDDAVSLGKVPLTITELAGSVADLAGFTTGLGTFLDVSCVSGRAGGLRLQSVDRP